MPKCAPKGRNGIQWSARIPDSRRGLAAKDVEQEFTRGPPSRARRFACSSHLPLVGSGPLNLEPQPCSRRLSSGCCGEIPPQGRIHLRSQVPGFSCVGSAEVLVMNKKLVEVRQRPDPPRAEEADRWAGPDPRDQPGEVVALSQSDPAPLREPLEGARQDEAGPSDRDRVLAILDGQRDHEQSSLRAGSEPKGRACRRGHRAQGAPVRLAEP